MAPEPWRPTRRLVIEEGAIAFSLNIDLSCAVKAMLSSARSRQLQRNKAP